MRYSNKLWLFDCGESTQLKLQSSRIRLSKISKIFISHTHGDHAFGLGGVLCKLGEAAKERLSNDDINDIEPIDIYGPEGIRDYIRAVLQLTYSRVAPPHRIHELKGLHVFQTKKIHPSLVSTVFTNRYGERTGGRDIYPNSHGEYKLTEDDDLVVYAAPMDHTVPCVGFIVQEKMRLGHMKPEKALAAIDMNLVSTCSLIV
jgi:ribonuclease Z